MDDPTLDTLMVLIAELHKSGTLDTANLTSMGRRLDLADLPEIAERVRFIPYSNAVDTPQNISANLKVFDGGNGSE